MTSIALPDEVYRELLALASSHDMEPAQLLATLVSQERHGEKRDEIETAPEVMNALQQAIQMSRSMLDLPDNWDNEGSPAYSQEAWQHAVDFLTRNATRLWQERHVLVEAPRILPGPDGSIDLHWRSASHELLVNIPATGGDTADYYGDDTQGHAVNGKLSLAAKNDWLLMWLSMKRE